MSTKMNTLFLLIFLVCFLIAVRADEEKKMRVCGTKQIKQLMVLLCPDKDRKRARFYSSEIKNNRLTLWKNIFNINDNTSGKFKYS